MALEAASWINDLVVANPDGDDAILQGDDHIRLMKTVLKATFPNADKAFYFPDALSKAIDYTILSTDINKFLYVDVTVAARTMTLPTLGASNDGWSIWIQKVDSTANDVVIAGTINGVTNLSLKTQWAAALVWWDGTAWKAIAPQVSTDLLGALTAPAVGDTLPIYDVSADAHLQITLANMFKVIDTLTAEATLATDDKVVIYDTSGTSADSMTIANFLKIVNVLTAETAPAADDYFMLYDTSASTADKVSMALVNPFGFQLLHVRDEKASGTDGGTFTVGAWRTRTLNTSKTNEITGASLVANQITLPAGTYYIEASAPAFNGDHQAKLRNVTDGSDTIIGTTSAEDGSDPTQTRSHVHGRFTIASSKTFELQHQTSNSQSTTGFGRAVGFGVVEVYAEVMIWKVL